MIEFLSNLEWYYWVGIVSGVLYLIFTVLEKVMQKKQQNKINSKFENFKKVEGDVKNV